MNFSDKIYKLSTGKNLTAFPLSESSIRIFSLNTSMQNSLLTFQKFLMCSTTNCNVNYEYIKQLSENLFVVAYDKNMSVINEL